MSIVSAQGLETMPIAGGRESIVLRGPSALVLKLAPAGAAKAFDWEPEDRQQQEVEIRMRMLGTTCALGQIPLVRWNAKIGHGKAVWSEPAANAVPAAGEIPLGYSLPARGKVLRLNVRELHLSFVLIGPLGGGAAIPSADVQVSVMPCRGMHLPVLPYQYVASPVGVGVLQPFPTEAREWRCTDANGAPLAVGAVTSVYCGIGGAIFGALDLSTVFDWQPIPHNAIGWKPSTTHYADFR